MACARQAMSLCFKASRESQPARRSKDGSSRCYMLQPPGPEICEYLACFCRPDCDEGILRSTHGFSPTMCRWRIERAEGVHGRVTGSRAVLDCCSKGRGQ